MFDTRSFRHTRRLSLKLGNRLPAETSDISEGGFSVEAPFVFIPGSLLHGTVEVAGRELPFRGEVVWANPARQQNAPSRMGVRFTQLPAEAHGLLLSPA
jgi:Tfp pilus assembly protein PilZ